MALGVVRIGGVRVYVHARHLLVGRPYPPPQTACLLAILLVPHAFPGLFGSGNTPFLRWLTAAPLWFVPLVPACMSLGVLAHESVHATAGILSGCPPAALVVGPNRAYVRYRRCVPLVGRTAVVTAGSAPAVDFLILVVLLVCQYDTPFGAPALLAALNWAGSLDSLFEEGGDLWVVRQNVKSFLSRR